MPKKKVRKIKRSSVSRSKSVHPLLKTVPQLHSLTIILYALLAILFIAMLATHVI